MTRGSLVKACWKIIRAKHPATVLLPVLMLMFPEVSDPLIEAVPPFPSTAPLTVRVGDGPVKLIWFGTCSIALPLRIKRVTVICEAVIAPLNDDVPATLRSAKVVLPCTANVVATCKLFDWVVPRLAVPEIVILGP